jgi:Cytochrome B561, N terminal
MHQAVEVYQRLAALLAGEAPRSLLPPAPRGYVALRIRQLAGGAAHCAVNASGMSYGTRDTCCIAAVEAPHEAASMSCGVSTEGTCVTDFTWNGGGAWQGRAWTPDLPTDAALLFYLFAAFLEAPRCARAPCKQVQTPLRVPLAATGLHCDVTGLWDTVCM